MLQTAAVLVRKAVHPGPNKAFSRQNVWSGLAWVPVLSVEVFQVTHFTFTQFLDGRTLVPGNKRYWKMQSLPGQPVPSYSTVPARGEGRFWSLSVPTGALHCELQKL